MATPVARDTADLSATLAGWLRRRLPAEAVTITDLVVPTAGYSNETILGTATWTPAGDPTRHDSRRFVLRIQPSEHQVFVAPDALRQARVIEQLAGLVPVPGLWLTEADAAVLGAPFYLMDRVDGKVPPDLPSWHKRGWAADLAPQMQGRLYDNALQALVRLHGIDWTRLAFLEPPGTGSHLERYLAQIEDQRRWCEPVLRYGAEIIDAAAAHLRHAPPVVRGEAIVWGDARVGNIIFSEDLSVAAMLDWESATIGPREIDVGWWLMFERFLCEEQGLARLPGVPGRQATIDRYQELSGYELTDIEWFEILAGLVFALINSRIADLLIRAGTVPPAVAAEYVTRVTTMLARWLER